ncbi:MAG: aldo/keto reductase, partial [Olsenella sp.]|nr:aldo/keto reductase [Olsenella sp.]
MIYRSFADLRLSGLGLGAMRLPTIGRDDSVIDEPATVAMVDYAMERGINYFDTAWGYHGGHSEEVLGRALARHPRESFYLATKFPGYDNHNFGKAEQIFEEQLEKCGVDHFDFYLCHDVEESNIDDYLDDDRFGTVSYLLEQKRAGRIRHLGFSCHGDIPVLEAFLEAYGEHMEFCQLQINYMDWHFQNASEKVALLRDRGIPLWVMEPLRGGRLATLPDEHAKCLGELRPDESVPAWAFRFLQTIPEITMVLSGMSNMRQLEQNIATWEDDKPLSTEEWDALLAIGDAMTAGIPCTACHYCVSHCPMGLDIPYLISLYNRCECEGDEDGALEE